MNTGSFDNGLAIIYTNEALIVVKVTLEEEKKIVCFSLFQIAFAYIV